MANSLTEVEQIAWERVCERAESMNSFLQTAEMYKPEGGYSEAAGNTIRIPYANQVQTTNGLDLTGNEQDVADITVPISTSKSDIKNSFFSLDVTESRFERRVKDNIDAGIDQLAVDFNTDITNIIRDEGALVGAETGNLSTYSDFAKGDALLREVQAPMMGGQYMYLGPRNALNMANELGSRDTDNKRDHGAYEYGKLPSIAQFHTYKSDVIGELSGSSSSGVTVNGANQDVTPVAYDSNLHPNGYAAGETDDVRSQTLAVSASHGLVAGDAFTIAGVNRVSHLGKQNTGQSATFRVTAVNGNNLTISPAIVSDGAYRNVSAAPANGAAITVVNTAAAEPVVFSASGACTFFVSDINWAALEGSAHVVNGYTTKYGLSIYFLREGSATTGAVRYRLSAWGRPNIVKPEYCGILLPGQGAAV